MTRPAPLLFCLIFAAATALAAERPNVLFIAVDDLRPELGCYGHEVVRSPHIDRLAARGVTFMRAYCQQAVCSPSRTSLMTGLRPDSTQVYDLVKHFRDTVPDVVTLPQYFKSHGYHAIGMGKLYHGGLGDEASWSVPWRPGPGAMYNRPENQRLVKRKQAAAKAKGLRGKERSRASRGPPTESADVPDSAYPDGGVTDLAVKSLAEMAGNDAPFFLAVGYLKPHLPFNCPQKYWDLYDRDAVRLPEVTSPPRGAPSYALTTWGELRVYEGMPEKGPVSEAQARELIHGYHACISFVDAQIGRLLDALDANDLTDNTVVVLWGDHGWKLGEYGAWCKHTNFELDARVPLILAAPGAKAKGKTSSALVEFVDIYPTLAELAGLPLPAHLEGTSMVPLLKRPERIWKRAAFSQYPRSHQRQRLMGYSMRTDRHRYTEWRPRKGGGPAVAVELYDHRADPLETRNLADKPEHADLVEQLSRHLDAGWKEAGPPR